MTIGVIGNCQAGNFSASIRAAFPEAEIRNMSSRIIITSDDEGRNKLRQSLVGCNVIFTQPADQRLGSLSADKLTDIARVVVYPYIVFRGFHPDCGYVSSDGKSVENPPLVYHSTIAAASFLEGLSLERAEMLFNAFTYASLRYFDLYREGFQTLSNFYDSLGYKLIVDDGDVFMHTINHPTARTIHSIAIQALQKAGLNPDPETALPEDQLAKTVIWPVYPELAEHSGIDRGGFDFRITPISSLSLREMIEKSYDVYRKHGKPFTSPQVEYARQFIQKEAIP
jgi:hypothetical protein